MSCTAGDQKKTTGGKKTTDEKKKDAPAKISPLWKKKPQGVVQGLGLTTAHHIFCVLTTSNSLYIVSMFQNVFKFRESCRCDYFLCFKTLCFKCRDKRWRCTNLTGGTTGGQEEKGCTYQGIRGVARFPNLHKVNGVAGWWRWWWGW